VVLEPESPRTSGPATDATVPEVATDAPDLVRHLVLVKPDGC
jgi:hypothetical protein